MAAVTDGSILEAVLVGWSEGGGDLMMSAA